MKNMTGKWNSIRAQVIAVLVSINGVITLLLSMGGSIFTETASYMKSQIRALTF